MTMLDDLDAIMGSITKPQHRAIQAAMDAANPDKDGDLMRELEHRGVADLVQDTADRILAAGRRRPRYVPGWRP